MPCFTAQSKAKFRFRLLSSHIPVFLPISKDFFLHTIIKSYHKHAHRTRPRPEAMSRSKSKRYKIQDTKGESISRSMYKFFQDISKTKIEGNYKLTLWTRAICLTHVSPSLTFNASVIPRISKTLAVYIFCRTTKYANKVPYNVFLYSLATNVNKASDEKMIIS
jgi:hypothetical protein